jgi:hypothetical protein
MRAQSCLMRIAVITATEALLAFVFCSHTNSMELGNPTSERCHTHILCDCEAIAYLRFCHLGQFFMEPSDCYGAPINRVLHFIQSVGIIGVNQRGSTIDQWWLRCKGQVTVAHPYTYIHTRMCVCMCSHAHTDKKTLIVKWPSSLDYFERKKVLIRQPHRRDACRDPWVPVDILPTTTVSGLCLFHLPAQHILFCSVHTHHTAPHVIIISGNGSGILSKVFKFLHAFWIWGYVHYLIHYLAIIDHLFSRNNGN